MAEECVHLEAAVWTFAPPGFLPGIFFRGGKIYCYANFVCHANFSIVFGPNFGGGQTASGGALPL